MAGVTNYAAKANEEAELAKKLIEERPQGPALPYMVAEAQVHATLAAAYATLAVFTATGHGR